MMNENGLLNEDAILPALKVNSKKQLLQELAAKAHELTGMNEREIFNVILQRERLGSTGVGNGIALPHGMITELNEIIGIFSRLSEPVDFESNDDQPVDLVFLLLAPESAGSDHLKSLSRIARIFRDDKTLSRLRGTDDKTALFAIFNESFTNSAG